MAKPETLKSMLEKHNVDKDIINTINNGYENVTNKSTKKQKAEYLFHAVNEMDKSLDKDTCKEILEECACTIGSSLEKKVRQFAVKANGLPLKEQIKLGKLSILTGSMGNPILRKDNTILVNLANVDKNGKYVCPCPQVSGVGTEKPKTHTYCLCCGGHLKYQYEIALGRKLDVKVQSSPFESNGKKPCVFILTVVE